MMTNETKLGGTFAFPGTSSGLYRMGYGAMQLAGPEIFGPPRDVDAAIAVLRDAMGFTTISGISVSIISTSSTFASVGCWSHRKDRSQNRWACSSN
jgi:hypothetical protein